MTSVQILFEFHKIQKRGDKGCYSDPIGITGSLSNAAAVRAAPRAPVRARSCLLACVARRRGRPGSLPPSLKHQHGRRRAFSPSRAEESRRASLSKFTVLDPSPVKLSTPPCSPQSYELSAPPSSFSNPPSRQSSSVLLQLRPRPPP